MQIKKMKNDKRVREECKNRVVKARAFGESRNWNGARSKFN